MALRLTHENLPAAYEYLRACEPFCRWKLPHADEIGFAVTRHRDRYAHMQGYQRSTEAEIAVSERMVGTTKLLMEVMAHEMIHLHQHLKKLETAGTMHNADFMRRAKVVCKRHGFDLQAFV